MVEQVKSYWYDNVPKWIPVLTLIAGAFYGIVTAYNHVKDLREDVNAITTRDIPAIRDQIARQYSTNSNKLAEQQAKIDEIRDWMNFHKGYEQAIKDYRLK